MRKRVNQDLILGALALFFGLFIIFYWASVDSDTGIAEKVRGRLSIGDALAPTVAGAVIAFAGIFIALGGWMKPSDDVRFQLRNVIFVGALLAIIAVSFAVIRFLGLVVADLAGADYRVLRDTVPWKYLGFFFGGGGMIFALISLTEGRVQAKRLAVALGIAGAMMLIYDLPFEDLLMPPNGDV